MTELDRMRIVENMFPDWREHLNDGRVIDHVLDGLTGHQVMLNKCSRPSCKNVARPGRKTCLECATKVAEYMRTYERRKSKNTKAAETGSGQKAGNSLTTDLVV
jgi:hypothetical protein